MLLKGVNLESLNNVALSLLESISFDMEKSKNGAYVIHLVGEIGAGKTTFTKCLANVLGVKETVHSPTFIVMREYDCVRNNVNKNFDKLFHIDGYRFENKSESEILNLKELVLDSKNIILIEWPERMHSPKFNAELLFSIPESNREDDNLRDIKISYAK